MVLILASYVQHIGIIPTLKQELKKKTSRVTQILSNISQISAFVDPKKLRFFPSHHPPCCPGRAPSFKVAVPQDQPDAPLVVFAKTLQFDM